MSRNRVVTLVLVTISAFGFGCNISYPNWEDGFVSDDSNIPEDADITASDQGADPGADTTGNDIGDVKGDSLSDAEIPGDTAVPNDFLTGTARIEGHAYFNNLTDHSGINIKLFADTNWDQAPLAATRTASDGSFAFDGVPKGLYHVVALREGFTLEPLAATVTSYIKDGETEILPDLRLTATGKIAGTAKLTDGATDHSGISIYDPGRDHLVATDVSGAYEVTRLLPGMHSICAAKEGRVGHCIEPVAVTALEVTQVPQIDLPVYVPDNPVNATVTGRVILVGADDSSGITVQAAIGNSFTDHIEAVTDSSGNYSFDNVRPGEYAFKFIGPLTSAFEKGAVIYPYMIYGGIDEVIPPQVLGRGDLVDQFTLDAPVTWARFSADSRYILYRTPDNSLFTWNVGDGQQMQLLQNLEYIQPRPGSSFLLYTHNNAPQLLYSSDLSGGSKRLITSEFAGFSLISNDSSHFVFATTTEELYLSEPGAETSGLLGDFNSANQMMFTDDSMNLLIMDRDRKLTVLNVGSTAGSYERPSVKTMTISPDSRMLVTCDEEGEIVPVNLSSLGQGWVNGLSASCTFLLMPSKLRVVFSSTEPDATGLFAADFHGNDPVLLTTDIVKPLAITPDSTKVVYALNVGLDLWDIYSVNAAGGTPKRLYHDLLLYSDEAIPGQPEIDKQALRGFKMGRDSDVIYLVPNVDGTTVTERSLHRIKLDGTEDKVMMPVSTEIPPSGHTLWDVNEEAGFAIAAMQNGWTNYYPLADDWMTTIATLEGPGLMAPDYRGILTKTAQRGDFTMPGNANLLTWILFDDLKITFLNLIDGSESSTGYEWSVISPDSQYIMYASVFGRNMSGGYLDSAMQGIRVVWLDQAGTSK